MKTISFALDKASIGKAISEIRQYADEVKQGTELLRQKVAERVGWSAAHGFSTALVGDVVRGAPPANDVHVTVEHGDSVSVVFAEGDQAVFIEYGAGVYNNGAAGSSPHPWGAQFGYYIGGYGQGKGKRQTWGYYDESGKLVLTHGTPAAMPMYNGLEDAKRVIEDLAREVFG